MLDYEENNKYNYYFVNLWEIKNYLKVNYLKKF